MKSTSFLATMAQNTRIFRVMLAVVGCMPSDDGAYSFPHLLAVLLVTMYGCWAAGSCIVTALPNDIDQIAYNVTPFIAQILLISKLINYIIRRTGNYKLLKLIEHEFWVQNEESPARERKIIEHYGRLVYLSNVVELIPMYSATNMWLLLPLFDMLLFQRNSQQPFRWVLPFNHGMPFNINSYSHPLYEILYILQICGFILGVTVLTGMDCLYVHYVMSTCAQFKILQMRIREFDKDDDGSILTVQKQTEKVEQCVKLHQKLLDFSQTLEDLLNVPMFVNFFVGIIFLCTAGFLITMFPGNTFIYLQNFLCISASISELFLLCFTANQLTTEGMEVAVAAYDSNWFNSPSHIKKHILLIIMRAQRPINITVGGFAATSVATFESEEPHENKVKVVEKANDTNESLQYDASIQQILRTAASYFTVLSSMNQNN